MCLVCCRMPWLALKILPSGYVGTSSLSIADGEGRAKTVSTGVYAFYQVRVAVSGMHAFEQDSWQCPGRAPGLHSRVPSPEFCQGMYPVRGLCAVINSSHACINIVLAVFDIRLCWAQ